ncbi:hypothetical protein LY90DRAFT_155995 [Neocallimastix californiae]|uniref:Uncharacterized protein n=1 Tax=Neocallimastix californiae TaxID=1754190 RepID=A0A1Y2AD61_9FUNG|nr:hypothetical protein LY90DRAFT_155995 [Neocallimastix californiae]|eukprot:ORY20207.1 hypothetical protein LY90DRAFT_155995 [Neocallimastix californiae]
MSDITSEPKIKKFERPPLVKRNEPMVLPEKFDRPEIWNYESKKQNMFYTTSSNDYGFYKPTKSEMPTSYYSVSHEFTKVN